MPALRQSVSDAQPFRADIEGLRAVAVSLVVAFHAFPEFMPGGFIGVDVFFVISGFLITRLIWSQLRAGSFRLTVFYRRRVRRIVPALLMVLMSCAIIGWYVLLPGEFRWLGQSLAWCAPFLANVFFARTGSYFDTANELNPLLHLWSLGVEEQFYLLWPVLLWAGYRFRLSKPLLLSLMCASMSLSLWGIWHSPGARFFTLATRAWELGVGAALVLLPARRLFRWHGAAMSGLALIAVGAFCLNSQFAFPGVWGLLPTSGAALIIASDPEGLLNRRVLATPVLAFVGRISYPLYLWHWPALAFARIVLGHPPSALIALSAVACSVAAAVLTYRYIETPVRSGYAPRAAVQALLGGLTCVTLLGWMAHSRHFLGRLEGPQIAVLDQAIDDWHYPGGFNFGKSASFRLLQAPSRRGETALFIGDSHMEQYWPRVKYLIDTRPTESRSAWFATYVGCPPLPGINSPRRGWACDGFFRFAIQQAQRPEVDSVVFGAFWEVYWLGEFAAAHSRQTIFRAQDFSRQPLRLDSPETQRVLEEFERTLGQLVHSGRRVFIVLSNPTSPLFDPVSLVPLQARLKPGAALDLRIDDQRRWVDIAEYEEFVAPMTSKLRTLALRTGALVIDPRSGLCEGHYCRAVSLQDAPLYLDSNHLRPFFARERAVFLDPILLGGT